MSDEVKWNIDLIKLLQGKLRSDFPKTVVFKGKVLKDIFLSKWKGKENYLQFGFVDQDIVIYEETLDLHQFKNMKNIYLHNLGRKKEELVIPKIIIELKYDGVNSHGLITYSNYAAEIKSIFPNCRYYLVMRYKNSSSDDKLFRHGKYFDRIMHLDEGKCLSKGYDKGQFVSELKKDRQLNKKFTELIMQIKIDLEKKDTYFTKY